jgi:outer membrane protein OmpA-like peptidoglycan-associated protein
VTDYLTYSDSLILFEQNTTIDWYGLGDVAEPQMALSNHNRNNLKAIWEAIITRGKGKVVFHDDAPGNKVLDGLPEVSVVDLQPQPLPQMVTATQPIIFSEATLHFEPNLAVFIDQQAALDTLRPYAAMLANDPTLFVHLVGTTASFWGDDSLAASYQLSQERADKVRDTLIALGAPAKQMETEGQAYLDIWHLDEYDQFGNYLPNVASQNRKVVMLDAHMPHQCVL